ncbi:MAG: ketoacyl-ACP synthase III [Magnetococcales bacterium]|nr:ketoacyl-ACP synthase III [Magnetococcales bacterium]
MKYPLARITGTGSCLPEKRLGNAELARMVDTTEEWIFSRTGISERRIAAPGELTSDLAVGAARQALAAAGVGPERLDMIIVATTTADHVFPATATVVQHKLGVSDRHAPALDLQAVCAGFIYGLSVAEKYILSGSCQRILLIGAEVFSRLIDWTDRSTCILFGDGAGAVILEAAHEGERGILSTHIHADGSYLDLLKGPSGIAQLSLPPPLGEKTPAEGIRRDVGYMEMRGNDVFKHAVKAMGQVAESALSAHGLTAGDLTWLVPHQANVRIIQSITKRVGIDPERVVVTVDRHGNTSAASVPLALDDAVRDGRIKQGDLVLLDGFGGGFTWGAALIRW